MTTRKKRPEKLKVYLMDDNYAFIQDPEFHGKWLRVEKCVALYGCPVCKAKTGEPCQALGGSWGTQSHYQRRQQKTRLPQNLREAIVVE